MLIRFSNNLWHQIRGILTYNKKNIFIFILLSGIATALSKTIQYYNWIDWEPTNLVDPLPVTLLGAGLAIFLGFRNNSAYDRWWEARKIWGGVVNTSRTFGRQVTTLISLQHTKGLKSDNDLNQLKKELVYRHIGWVNALRIQLRQQDDKWGDVAQFLDKKEFDQLMKKRNKATQLIQKQGERITDAMLDGLTEDFRHIQFDNTLTELYNLQGQAERIKNTVFPYYYSYFTGMFLWLFLILLPFSLVGKLGWATIPLSTAVSFVFSILHKSGGNTEDPFEGRAIDTPLTTICNTIEIDLKEQLGESDIPEKHPVQKTKFNVEFFD